MHRALTSTSSTDDLQELTTDQMIARLEQSAVEARQQFEELKDRLIREGKVTPEQMAELEQRVADVFAADERRIDEMFPAFSRGFDLDEIGRRFDDQIAGIQLEATTKAASIQRRAVARAAAAEREAARRVAGIQGEAITKAARVQQEAAAKAATIDREVAAMLSGFDQETARLTDAGWGDVSGRR